MGICAIVVSLLLQQMFFYSNNVNSSQVSSTDTNDNVIVQLQVPSRSKVSAIESHEKIHSSHALFQQQPPSQEHTFYIPCGKNCHVMIRALRVLGWTRVNTLQEAQLVWTFYRQDEYFKQLASWQRYNFIRTHGVFHEYPHSVSYIPETFNLTSQKEAFQERLVKGRLDERWVLKRSDGKSTTILELNSPVLKIHVDGTNKGMIQEYVCNEMAWNGRKFYVQTFFFVSKACDEYCFNLEM